MTTYETEAKTASKQLDNSNISITKFNELFQIWYRKKYDWRVHLGLVMSSHITKEQFLQLFQSYGEQVAVQEECLSQMGRFTLSSEEKAGILSHFLPPKDTHNNPYAWNTTQRIAMRHHLAQT